VDSVARGRDVASAESAVLDDDQPAVDHEIVPVNAGDPVHAGGGDYGSQGLRGHGCFPGRRTGLAAMRAAVPPAQ